MEQNTVIELITASLQNIIIFDSVLLERRVREECVNHRLAFYMEAIYEEIARDERFYCVDLEYNKNVGRDDKGIKDEYGKDINIRPDIIVHKRESNEDNLIAVEAKHETISKHDLLKLSRLLEDPYNYKYAVAISYYPERNHFLVRLFLKNGGLRIEEYKIDKIANRQVHLTGITLALHTGK